MGKNLVTGGGVMQLPNDTSKNSTSTPYLVKNERSLTRAKISAVRASGVRRLLFMSQVRRLFE